MGQARFAVLLLLAAVALLSCTREPSGSGGAGAAGPNGQYRCPMCGQRWDGYPSFREIPSRLPAPQAEGWIDRLREVLRLEELSKTQYVADSRKFQVRMPYAMVIPQEDDHIAWINQLFSAYGVPSDGEVPAAERTETLEQAYRTAMQLEADLVPKYEWLIANANQEQTGEVLNTILYETRMHYTMFEHALSMGRMHGGMGRGMGPGRGPGMGPGAPRP